MNSNLYLYYISWSSLFDRNCVLKHFGILRLRAESSVIFVHDICSCFTTVIKSIAFWFYSLQVWVDTSLCKTFNFSVKWGKTIFTRQYFSKFFSKFSNISKRILLCRPSKLFSTLTGCTVIQFSVF